MNKSLTIRHNLVLYPTHPFGQEVLQSAYFKLSRKGDVSGKELIYVIDRKGTLYMRVG